MNSGMKIRHLLSLVCILLLAGCSNIECPLENIVALRSGLYTSEDHAALELSDTLTVRVAGSDSVLLNRAIGISSFELPVRYRSGADTFLLRFSNSRGQAATDSIILNHTNMPHFENIDCPAAMFHTIDQIRWTSHTLREMPLTIDSVDIARRIINYDTQENLRIYLRSTASQ